jgi:hypothetical protein
MWAVTNEVTQGDEWALYVALERMLMTEHGIA